MKRKKLLVWLCLEMAVVGAVTAQTPARPGAAAAPVAAGAPAAAAAPAGAAPVAPAAGGTTAKGAGTGTAKKSGAQTMARGRAGVTPTVIVDPNTLAGGGYGGYGGNAAPAPPAPIPSPFPASARGKDGKNVITTETVTSDSVR